MIYCTLCHMVISLEGLYVIMLGECNNKSIVKENFENIIEFININCKPKREDYLTPEKYCKYINSLRFENGLQLIKVEFYEWENIRGDLVISLNTSIYKNKYKYILTTDKSMRYHNVYKAGLRAQSERTTL